MKDVELVTKVKTADVLVFKRLVEVGLECQLTGTCVIVRGWRAEVGQVYPDYEYKFIISEKGNRKNVRVICGLNGEMLKPFYIPRVREVNGPHAVFCLWAGVYVILKVGDIVAVGQLTINTSDGTPKLVQQNLYRGPLAEAPIDVLKKFSGALEGAIHKLQNPTELGYCIHQ